MKEIQQEITPITNEDLFINLNHPNAHFDYPIHCHPEYEKIIDTQFKRQYYEALPEADIRWSAEPTAEGYAVTLTSDRFVRAAWLSLDGNEHFEDNYFDLLPASAARSGFRRNSPGTNSTGCCESPICNKPDKPTIRL